MTGSAPDIETLIRLRHGDARDHEALARLAEDPQVAARLADWDRQDAALRALYAPLAAEPLPERHLRLLRPGPAQARPPRPGWLRLAAALLLALGFGGGWLAARPGGDPAGPQLEAALRSHETYAPEVLHAVEVGAADEAHLLRWLSRRLGRPLHPPDFAAQGFRLIGGRLLPGLQGPAALLIYEDDLGRRLSLYITRARGGEEMVFAEAAGARAFWWVEGDLGCALVGDLPRDKLRAMSIAAYHALEAA
ncbi:anti-sigma factor [Paracoccus sp. (in: a-proteobacteria)]|uniref:anti-sigma factor family protein n=1 Tax=Paracoccus sp. TaxID=267 RepID=UPI00321F6ECE